MAVHLHLFGSPTIESGGSRSALAFERRSQVLAYLALERTWVGRAQLAALLWPEQETRLAYANLRKTLFRLQSLPWGERIELEGNAVRFEAVTDVFQFESALREGRIAEALILRSGELLIGFEDDTAEAWSSWLQYERDRLRAAWRAAALERLAAGIDADEGIALSARMLEEDPLDEAALGARMRWLAESGQSARARQAYREFAERLADDLGLAPGTELKALHDALGTSTLPAAPPTPAPEDGFVGRSTELRRISELLARPECRLLCIVGPGGIGKTRLARRALQVFAPGHADGAVFVPLEDVASPEEIGARLARELGVALSGRAEPLEQVIDFLRVRQMLLALDNFEHLAGDAAILDRVLEACGRLKLLVTSRVRLAADSPWSLPLEGLPCPEMEDRDRIESFDAARLFVNAARRVEPALIPQAEAASIVEICRRVEGLPLALELAAAWTRVLSCEAIAAELRRGTDLLAAAESGRPGRHAGIDAVFEQSWRLLAPVERDTLARLSVFHGGFPAEAARAVAGASLPVLGALADRSLLRKDGERIALHSLVQQLAATRLSGELRESTEAAQARYFHRLLAQLRRRVEDGDREAMRHVDTELENGRVAWRWSIAHGQADALAASTMTLLHYFDHRGRWEEGRSLLMEALDAQPLQADPRLGPLLSAAVAHLEYRLDRYAEAQARAMRALAASRSTADHDARLQCFKVLGAVCLRLGRHSDARRHFRLALQQSPAETDPHNAAAMLDNLALVEKAAGRYAESQRMSTESLVQHRRLGDVAGEALCLNNLGALQMDHGELDSAAAHFGAGLDLCERHGLANTRGFILANLTELALKRGDADAARANGERALEAAQASGNRAIESWLRLQFVRVALMRGDLPGARSDLRTSLELASAIGRPALQLAGVSCFAEILEAQGERDCARRVLAFAAGHPAMDARERDVIRGRLSRWGPAKGARKTWAGPALEDLVNRIVLETTVGHAPLITTIRS